MASRTDNCLATEMSLLDLSEHVFNITRWEFALGGGTCGFQLLADVADRFPAARYVESLADLFGQGHAPGTRHSLYFTVVRVLENYVQPLSHQLSIFNS